MQRQDTKNTAGAIAAVFDFRGEITDIRPFGNGHINSTFRITCEDGAGTRQYILQRINGRVFKDPVKVMKNIIAVTSYLRDIISKAGGDPARETMNLIKTRDGGDYYFDGDGECWRAFAFIRNTVSLDMPETENDFYQSAIAFGNFQRMLIDYPADTLYETIPDFHNTPVRYENFLLSLQKDASGRAANCVPETEFIKERVPFMSVLEDRFADGSLVKRVTHNDTKLNNVMLDKDTREAVCVIDLDTIMPGYSVNDFGDSIRFGASTAAEDEPDLDKVHFDLRLFETYAKGFLTGCGGSLSDTELHLLPAAAKLMTLECGMRFLTDYIDGDVYFKTAYPEHNLIRCRTQFKLVSEMERKYAQMERIIGKYTK